MCSYLPLLQKLPAALVIRKVKVTKHSSRVSLREIFTWKGLKHLKLKILTTMTGNFVCNMCGKQFKSHKMLTQHNRDVHIEGDFPCTLCDKTFRTKKHLANHVFIKHKEKESMQCNSKSDDIQCTYETTSVSNLNKHKKRVHEKIAIPPNFACSSCVQNNMDCIFMTPLHCLFALSLFSGWVFSFKGLLLLRNTLYAFSSFEKGKITTHKNKCIKEVICKRLN